MGLRGLLQLEEALSDERCTDGKQNLKRKRASLNLDKACQPTLHSQSRMPTCAWHTFLFFSPASQDGESQEPSPEPEDSNAKASSSLEEGPSSVVKYLAVSTELWEKIKARADGSDELLIKLTDFQVELISGDDTERGDEKEPFIPLYDTDVTCILHFGFLKKASQVSVQKERTMPGSWYEPPADINAMGMSGAAPEACSCASAKCQVHHSCAVPGKGL